MNVCMLAAVSLVLLPYCHGFLFDVKTDCLTSPWTAWSTIAGLGSSVRERAILRYDRKGGLKCPDDRDLRQHKVDPNPLTTVSPHLNPAQIISQQIAHKTQIINATAHSVIQHFLRRSMNVQPVAGENGESHFRDLLIILDASGSIGFENFERTKRSLVQLLKTLCPDPDPFGPKYHHAAMIVYSSNVEEIFDFKKHTSLNDIEIAIKKVPYLDGATCTTDALERAFNYFSTKYGMRDDPKIQQEVLILSDGESNCGGDVFKAAANLRSRARVFALRIGEATADGMAELTNYVSLPIAHHLFAIEEYKELDSLMQMLETETKQMKCVPLDLP